MPEKDQALDSTQYHKKGVSPENARKLCLGGESAMEVFWELFIDLEEFVKIEIRGKSGLLKLLTKKLPDDGVVEACAIYVMNHAMNMAQKGTLIKALLRGEEDESSAFIKKPYLVSQCVSFLRVKKNSAHWQKRSTLEVEEQALNKMEDSSSVPLGSSDSRNVVFREKFPFPFHPEERLTRGHDFFVLQQFPKIEFCGGEKERESLDRISDWTGIPTDQLRHRLSQSHSDAKLRRDNQLQQLKSIDERNEIPSQKSRDRIDRITRIEKEGLMEPLKKEDLQVLFGVPLTSSDSDQNYKRYRDLCRNIGLADLLILKEPSEST